MNQQPDETIWQAWLYLHDELSPQQANAFEARLDEDVALCDALADAALIQQAATQPNAPVTCPVERFPSRHQTTQTSRAAVWATVVSLSLVMAWGLFGLLSGDTISTNGPDSIVSNSSDNQGPAESIGAQDKVLTVWAELAIPVEESESPIASSEVNSESNSSESESVPDWMFAALSVSAASHMDEMADDMEPSNREPL